MSERYGGKEYAMHSKGLEMASYEPRRSVGMGLGYATSNRGGCHLNGGYLALLESVGVLSMDALSIAAKPAFTAFFQNALEAISASGFCLFSAQSFVPAILFKLGPHHAVTRTVGKIAQRAAGLYSDDEKSAFRCSHENPMVQKLYADYLGAPLGKKSHHLLHTGYSKRKKYKR